MPGDMPLLAEFVLDHAPFLMERYGPDYEDYIEDTFCNDDRCSLDELRNILESQGWTGGAQGDEGELTLNKNCTRMRKRIMIGIRPRLRMRLRMKWSWGWGWG